MSSTGRVGSRYGVFILLALSPLFLATECDWDWALLGPLPTSSGPISGEGASTTVSTADPDDESGSVGRSGADPIDFATGAQICQRTLLTLRGARALDFTLRYYSLKPVAGVVGRGWEHNHEARLDLATPATPKVVWSASRSNGFTGNGTTFTSADAALTGATLVKAGDGTYSLSLKSRVIWKFSSTGALLEQRDAEGQVLTYATNAQSRVTRITEAVSGRTLDLAYDGNNRISTLTDSAARRCTLTYSAGGDLNQFTDAAGHRISFTYDAAGRALTCVDGENRIVFENTYDSSGRVVSQQDARSDNDPVKLVYDETSQAGVVVASVTNRAGAVTEYAHDALYRLRGIIRGISVDEAAAAQLLQELDDAGGPGLASRSGISPRERLRRILADQSGIQPAAQNVEEATYYVYEGGALTKIVDPTERNTLHTYDARGNLTQLTDRAGKVWTMSYDSRDNLLSSTDPVGRVTRYTYDSANHLLTRTDPTGLVTTSTYHSQGQLASCTPPGQGTTTYTYTAGQLSTITRPGGVTTTFTYDLAGRVASIRTGSGGTTTLVYDANDRVQELTLPGGGKRTFAYDSRGLLTRSTDALGQTTTFAYDGNGNRTLITHPDGSKVDLTYDDEDLLRTIGPTGGPRTTFVRDTQGRLEAMEDPAAGRTAFSYDVRGELVRVTDPAGKQVRLSYDELSRPVTVTNARNQALTATRDSAGRLTRLAAPNQTSDFTHDAAGRITRVVDGTETLDVTYGNQGNPTRLTYPDGQQTQVTYDTSGRLATLAYGGETVVHTYNDRGLLARVAWSGGAVDFTYDGSDNLTRLSRANSVTSQMTYDFENRLTRLVHAQGVATLTDLVITRDALGRVQRVDGIWPLEAAPALSNTIAAYAATNQVIDTSGTACSSDDDGNLTGGSAWRLTAAYDACNRMTSLVRGGVTSTFTYNGLGWRTKVVAGSATSRLHHDTDGRLLYETNAAGQVVSVHIWANQRVIATGTPATGYGYLHADHLGSVLAVTQAAGTVVASYAYTPFGEVLKRTGTWRNPFTFVGEYGVIDDGQGQFFMLRRHYDATLGRFFQRDPIGHHGGVNLYAYAGNDPATRIDPRGLAGISGDTISLDGTSLPPGSPNGQPSSDVSSLPEAIRDKFIEGVKSADEVLGPAVGFHPVYGPVYSTGKGLVQVLNGNTGEGVQTITTGLTGTAGNVTDIVLGGRRNPNLDDSLADVRKRAKDGDPEALETLCDRTGKNLNQVMQELGMTPPGKPSGTQKPI